MDQADESGVRQDSLETAWRLHREGDLAGARRLYAGLLGQDPGHPRALHRLGVLCYQEGEVAAAATLLDLAAQALPDDLSLLRHRGAVLLAADRLEEAARSFRRALAFEPGDPETAFNLGLTLRRLGRLEAAIGFLEQAAAGLGHLATVRYELALTRHLAGQGREAAAGYRRTLELDPGHADALNNLGVLLLQDGDPDTAVAAFQAALEARPAFGSALNNLASALMDRGELEAAAGILEPALERTPDFAEAWNTLGTVRLGQGQGEAAVAAFREALRCQPLSAAAHDNLAEALRDLGRSEEALEAPRAAAGAWPGDPCAQLILAGACRGAGDLAGAVEACRAAVALDGAAAESHHRLGSALVSGGALAEGIEHLHRAVALRPGQPPVLRELAGALLRAGDGAGAVAVCASALALDPFDQEALAYRALGLRLAGDTRAADALTDLQRWIHVTAPLLPPEAGPLEDFNRRLAADLRALKSRKWQPASQSIRGGTQTKANLFTEPVESIRILHRAIDAAVRAYLATLEADPDHPFLAGRPRRHAWRAWSVILEDQGYHVPHIHPEGWLSGACYIEIPDFDRSGQEDPGCIEFGLPWAELPFTTPPPTRRLPPAAGRLVLFPSYFWHGVRPFRSTGQRVTVAFDLLPLER